MPQPRLVLRVIDVPLTSDRALADRAEVPQSGALRVHDATRPEGRATG